MAAVFFLGADSPRELAINILFTNNTNGEVDPCGCVRNQRGGLGRRDSFVQYVRGVLPDEDELLEKLSRARDLLGNRRNVLLLDSGDIFFKGLTVPEHLHEQWQYRAEVIVNSYNIMGYDAVNVGAFDLIMGFDYLKRLEQQSNFPFLSANIIDRKTGQPLFTPYIRKRVGGLTVGVFGLISHFMLLRDIPGPGSEIAEIRDAFDTAQEMVNLLRPRCDIVIALTNLGLRDETFLAQRVKGIDLILGSHGDPRTRGPYRTEPAEKVGNTYVLQTGDGGKHIGMITIVVRNGSLDLLDVSEQAEIPKMRALVRDMEEAIASGEEKLTAETEVVLNEMRRHLADYEAERRDIEALMRSGDRSFIFLQMPPVQRAIEPNSRIEDMISAYKARVAQLHKERDRAIPETPITYVGAERCGECHTKQYEVWKSTHHAKAYNALVEVNEQFNPECIVCHTTGYRQKGGFFRVTDAEKLANVQCEVCHGRGRPEHFLPDNPAPTEPFNSDTCKVCHTRDQSPDFDYETAIKEVCAPNR